MRPVRGLLLALGGLVGWLPGQEQIVVHLEDERQVCSIKVTPYVGAARSGGLGFVHVDMQNLDGVEHVVGVRFASREWSGSNVDAEREVVLLPHERGRYFLPLPTLPRYDFGLTITVDAVPYEESLQAARHDGRVGLLISDRPQLEPQALALVQSAWPRPAKGKAKPGIAAVSSRGVPADWRLFTAFDAVIVDGRSEVGRDTQEALRRFACAGGRVLVIGADRLPAGALRQWLEHLGDSGAVAVGLGTITVAPSLNSNRLRTELTTGPSSESLWPLPFAVQSPQVIPGLDQAPVLMFLFVILLFAIVVGPVNFFLLRRKKKQILALVTVPALGFGTTLLMFGYAIVHDGFGVRGVVRSWSLLDQQRHEVSTVASRTLFAGLSPGPLAVGDDSLLLAPWAFMRSDRRSRHRWSYDGDTGEIAGAVVPARTLTVLDSARQGVARARLRCQMRADGELELLTGGGVVPVGEMLLRDFDGGYWVGRAPVLSRCSDGRARQWVESTRRSFRVHETRGDRRRGTRGGLEIMSLDVIANPLLRGADLSPGSYVATVSDAPWVPEHGLQVDYAVARHHVLGLLDREDFIR